MSELPPGFVMDGGSAPAQAGPPAGFVIDGAPVEKKKFGLGDTWPAQLAKSIYSAVTLPGDVAQGNVSMVGPDGRTNPEVINRSAELATIASPAPPRVAASILPKAAPPTREALATASDAGYTKARGLGVEVAPQAVSDLGTSIGVRLGEDGINGKLAPKTFSILDDLAKPPPDSVATLANIETIRRSFGHAARDFSNPTEQMAAKRAIGHLDDYLAAIPDTDVIRGSASEASSLLREARGNYAAAKRSEQITDAVDIADLNAAAANSGQNIGNATRQRIKSILASDKNSAGFTAEELAQMERIVRGTRLGNTARVAGNVLGGGGGLGSVASAAVGAGALGPVGAAAPAVGYLLKKLSNASVEKQTKILDAMIRSRSPLAGPASAAAAPQITPAQATILRAMLAAQQQ